MEPNFSRFFSVAPDLALSSELYVAIKKIIKSSPLLYDEANPVFKLLRKEVICKLNDNDYVPLAYSNDGLDGKLANCFLADECGALDDYPVEAMRSSQITLPEKLGIIISTQYPNDNNVFLTEVDIAKKTLDGVLPDTRYFSLLYEPDDELRQGDVWQTDDRCIYQANPFACHMESVFDNLKAKRRLAVLYENKRENFLCKHLNIQYKGLGTEGYVDLQKVRLCSKDIPDSWWNGRRVWLGLDLSQTDDNTAVAMLTEDYGEVYGKIWGFIPGNEETIRAKSEREHIDYRACISAGECFACGDEVIDYSFIEDFIVSLPKRYGVEIVQAGYDRYNAISTVQKLEQAGIECVEVKQHSSVLHAPTKLLKEMILNRQYHYDASRLYEVNFSNTRCVYDTNLNRYCSKKRSAGKIDEVMATLDALYLLQQEILFGTEEVIMY
jgi:phage terminase large subunit-like protein